MSHIGLLRALLDRGLLTEEERAQAWEVISTSRGDDARPLAERIVRALIERGQLAVIERVPEPPGERLRLRDPRTGFRFAIRVPVERSVLGPEVVNIPIETGAPTEIQGELVRRLLSDAGGVVLVDRVASPREIVQRMEAAFMTALGIESLRFLPIEAPAGELWQPEETPTLSLPLGNLRDLARSRSYLLHIRDFDEVRGPSFPDRVGSTLLLGIGDDVGGWRAVVELTSRVPGHFTPERMGLAVLLAGHFESLLSSAARLQSLIFIDFLTGLYNRSYFEDQFEKQLRIAERRRQSLALLIADIDNFRRFNTQYGYEGGDRALVTVGCVLKAAMRGSDTLARYGGEEFAALLVPPISQDEARSTAERLRSAIEEEPFQVPTLDGEFVTEKIRISVGGALFPQDGKTVREIWTAANRMLIEAKSHGKNQVRFVGDPLPGPDVPPNPERDT